MDGRLGGGYLPEMALERRVGAARLENAVPPILEVM
jgi:hypothetical protein